MSHVVLYIPKTELCLRSVCFLGFSFLICSDFLIGLEAISNGAVTSASVFVSTVNHDKHIYQQRNRKEEKGADCCSLVKPKDQLAH